MAITYSNVQVTKVLTLRGNTIQNNRYTGLPGELTVDTEAKTIRIHDGVTPGGNIVQGSGGAGSYANANVKVYLTAFDGNIIPSANNVYSLGTITNQWQHLYVSSNTIYIGGTAVTVTNGNLTVGNTTIVNTAAYTQTMGYTNYSNVNLASYLGGSVTIGGNLTVTGNLFLNGNTTLVSTNNLIINDNIIYIANANPGSSLDIGLVGHFTSTSYQHTGLVRQASSNQWQLFSNVVAEPGATIDFTNAIYYDIRVGNITSPTITGINANVAAANIGIKGYIDLANTIQSAQLTAANTAWAANAYQQSALIGNLQSSAYSNVNVAAYLTTNSYLTSNLANLSNYAYASNVTTANTGIKGYVDQANTIQSAQLTSANLGIIGYIDQANTIQSAQVSAANLAITAANVGMKGYVDSQSFYSNVKVSTYLPTYSGNIAANISKAGRTWTFGTDGKLTFAGTLTKGATFDGNDFIAAPNSFLELAGYTGNTYVGLDDNSVFIQTNWNTAGKQWTFGTDGNLTLPRNSRIAEVPSPVYGNYALSLSGTGAVSPDQQLLIYPTSVDANHLHLTTGNLYNTELFFGNDDLYVKLSNIGDVVVNTNNNQGNTAQWTFGADGITLFPNQAVDGGTAPIELKSRSWSQLTYNNADMNQQPNKNHSTTFYVEGGDALLEIFRWDSGNVMQHRQWTFFHDGNLTLPSGGYILNSDNSIYGGGNYSNVQVATYLPTYTGNISADIITASGNVILGTIRGNNTVSQVGQLLQMLLSLHRLP